MMLFENRHLFPDIIFSCMICCKRFHRVSVLTLKSHSSLGTKYTSSCGPPQIYYLKHVIKGLLFRIYKPSMIYPSSIQKGHLVQYYLPNK
ncbi:unnamed protein product, partial [Schistosoma bovis]